MIKQLLLIFLATSSYSYADSHHVSLLDKSVSIHPDVVSRSNDMILKGLNIEKILAEDGIKVNFSTDSKLPISSQGLSGSHLTDSLDDYFNGKVAIQKNIYDFGVVDHKIAAENSRKEVAALEYKLTYEKVTQKLLNTVNNIKRLELLIVNLEQTIVVVEKTIQQIKLRFTGGVGTIMDVRQAQLLLLDLEAEYQTAQNEYQVNLITLKGEFNITAKQVDQIQVHTTSFMKSLGRHKQVLTDVVNNDIVYQRSTEIINLEKSALKSEIESLKSEEYPQIKASITSVVYDIHRGFDEYEVYGAVDLVIPLYDSGLSSVKQRSVEHRLVIQDNTTLSLKRDKLNEFNELMKRHYKLQLDNQDAQERETNLTEKLKQLKLKLSIVETGLLTQLQTQLQLDQVKRVLASYPYTFNVLNIDYWTLNELLLEKLTLKVN